MALGRQFRYRKQRRDLSCGSRSKRLELGITETVKLYRFPKGEEPTALTSISDQCEADQCQNCPGIFHLPEYGDEPIFLHSCLPQEAVVSRLILRPQPAEKTLRGGRKSLRSARGGGPFHRRVQSCQVKPMLIFLAICVGFGVAMNVRIWLDGIDSPPSRCHTAKRASPLIASGAMPRFTTDPNNVVVV